MKKTISVKGTQPTKPSAIDLTSSATTVYLRENIIRVVDAERGDYWQYDETQMDNGEYVKYLKKEVDKQTRINSNNSRAILEIIEVKQPV